MAKKKSELQVLREKAEAAVVRVNVLIEVLGYNASNLYKRLVEIQDRFNLIRNAPDETRIEYAVSEKACLEWKKQSDKIEHDYNEAKNKAAAEGAAGVGAGIAVAALGPSAAMGVATAFGVASTGTPIAVLHGAAATNAALAWLGGGTLAAGGGGMAAGNAFLSLAGPVGWAIAGVALLGSSVLLFKGRNDKIKLERVFRLICERDVHNYELAMVELNERISRVGKECGQIESALERIRGFGLDYGSMSESQQYELGTYVNLMAASTQLLVNPIVGLQPKISEEDCADLSYPVNKRKTGAVPAGVKPLIVSLANLLYKIELDDTDRKLLWRSFRGNKKYLDSMGIKKRDFTYEIMDLVDNALVRKYKQAGSKDA